MSYSIRLTLKLAAFCLLMAATMVTAGAQEAAEETTEETKKAEVEVVEVVELEELMEEIGSDFKFIYKALKKALKDSAVTVDAAACLAAAQRLHDNAIKSKAAVPQLLVKMDDGDVKEQLKKDYIADIEAFTLAIAELQKRLTAQDYVAAMEQLKVMKKHRNDGHGKYQEDEKEDHKHEHAGHGEKGHKH